MPVYNEAATIARAIQGVLQAKPTLANAIELIVINDGSTDNTATEIQHCIAAHPTHTIHLIQHPANKGKGAAIRSGLQKVSGDYVIIQDADLEYDPAEYDRLLEPVVQQHADVVYGTRFSQAHAHRVLYFWHYAGNRFLTLMCNMFSNLNLTDMETCYKLMRTDALRAIHLHENRFGFEPEVTIKLAHIEGIRFYEVGISYHGRTYAEGKKIKWTDGLHAFWCIIKYGLFK